MLDLRTMQRMLGGEIAAGRLLCPGPGHSATDRSLSIKVDNDAPGGFVVHSFAGDNPIACKDYVRQKLGLPAFKPNGGDGHRASDDAIERALMAAMSTQDRLKAHVAATYDYTDAGAELLYQVLRLEPKSFRQRRPDGNGGWLWKLDDVRRVPYRWPELMKFPDATVFVTEGEKDADRVAALGHCATCVAGNKWTEDCVQALAGRDIVILQDNDDPGQANALEAAQALCGTAKSIRVVLLPDLPDKGDVSDWLDADPRRANKLIGVCFNVPVWTPSDGAGAQSAEPKRADSKPTLPFINTAFVWPSTAPTKSAPRSTVSLHCSANAARLGKTPQCLSASASTISAARSVIAGCRIYIAAAPRCQKPSR